MTITPFYIFLLPFYLFLSVLFGVLSYRMRWLTLAGSITASMFGFCLLWWGGWPWIVPVMVFFGTSSLLSKIGKKSIKKGQVKPVSEDIRNSKQVLANGGVGWLLLALYAIDSSQLWYAGFIGSLAAATADTWATEIGRLAGGQPRHIITGAVLPKHASGGVTWQGTGGSVAGAALIGASCVPFYDSSVLFCITFGCISGVAGSVFDSILGALLQAKYRVKATQEIVESSAVESETTLIQGWRWMTNDLVNVFCTLVGAAVAVAIVSIW